MPKCINEGANFTKKLKHDQKTWIKKLTTTKKYCAEALTHLHADPMIEEPSDKPKIS